MVAPAQSLEDVVLLREVLARTLEGLTRCEAWARTAQTPEVRALFASFVASERERFAAVLTLLQAQDGVGPAPHAAAEPRPEPEPPAPPPEDRAEDLGAPGPLASPTRAIASVEAAPGPITGRLTVGSLRTRGGTTHA